MTRLTIQLRPESQLHRTQRDDYTNIMALSPRRIGCRDLFCSKRETGADNGNSYRVHDPPPDPLQGGGILQGKMLKQTFRPSRFSASADSAGRLYQYYGSESPQNRLLRFTLFNAGDSERTMEILIVYTTHPLTPSKEGEIKQKARDYCRGLCCTTSLDIENTNQVQFLIRNS